VDSESNADAKTPLKPAREMLVEELSEGMEAFGRPWGGLLMSSVSAGVDMGISLLLMGIVLTQFQDELPRAVVELLLANMYAVGFIFVILGRAPLFTEETTLAIVPVIHGRTSLKALGRLWGTVFLGNLIGIAALTALIALLGPALEIVRPEAFVDLAEQLVEHPWWTILLSAMLVGWMMGLLSWLITAARDTISQILLVWLVAASIGLGHLHHSVLGVGEVLAGVFVTPRLTFQHFGHFLLWTTLGNVIGGVMFAFVLRYSYGVRGRRIHRGRGRAGSS
jgi:formate-nitrite transporter family protein